MIPDHHMHGTTRILDMIRAAGVAMLLLHFYYYCFAAFDHWGLVTGVSTRILQHIGDTGLFGDINSSKFLALLLLGLSLPGTRGRKSERFSSRSCVRIIVAGILVYFGSSTYLLRQADANQDELTRVAILYMVLSSMGFLLVLSGGARLARILPSPFRTTDPFGMSQTGFPQQEDLVRSDFSISLRAKYTWKGDTRDSWINLVNPRRGILIMGSPGSGKSWFIIEPILCQLMAKGMTLFVYDFKYDKLTRLVYHLFQANRGRYPPGTAFYSINFTDLSRSHRCNLLAPETLEWTADAIGASKTILLSMNKSWAQRQGEFFVESPVNFLAALIWFLRQYKDGIYCTLPHVIELAQVPYDKLFNVLCAEPSIHTLINSFAEAFTNNNMDMLDSQVSSAKIPLGRLASPDLYYILTGNDCGLDINNPAAPKILCLGGDPARQEALAPIISLYIDRMNKMINRPGKLPCALVCDEFATMRAYSMTTTIATARSNNIVPVLAIQDLNQLRTQYSREEADLILNITGNLFCGQVAGETARWVSERFPKLWQDRTSVTSNSQDTSINHSHTWEPSVTPATIANLSAGEFLGIVADDPDLPQELKAFHARIQREDMDLADGPLPVVRQVDADLVQENFFRVKLEVAGLIDSEMARIMGDDSLKGLL
jgi:hypothetical protein